MSDVRLPPVGALDDTVTPHVLEVLLAGGETADPTADTGKDKVLEVVQVFGDAVVDLKHFGRGRAVSLGSTLVKTVRGTHTAEDFFVPASLLPAPTHPLFEAADTGWACVVAPGWDGFVEGPAGRRAFGTLMALTSPGADGLFRLPIGADDHAVIEVGTTIFVARPVHPSKKVPVTGRDTIDYPLLGIAGFMGFVTVMLGVALSVMPSPSRASRMQEDDRLVEVLLNQPVDLPKPPSPAPGPAGARAKDTEGMRGEKDAKAEVERSPLTARERNAQAVADSGVIGALNNNAVLDAMLGDSGLSGALTGGIAGLVGPRATQLGNNGLGQRGPGFGGGGEAVDSAGLQARGRGPGADGFRPGGGERSEGRPADVDTGEIISFGALDKALIDAVVKRNMAQIKYCYQRELTKNPSLSGKVTVKFTIAKDGSVSSAMTKSSSMANPSVESCINARFMRFQFPEPLGGGLVVVSYPFLFSPG